MKRVTLDSNVWLSGLFWKAEASKIINLISKGKIKAFCSKEILLEIAEVFGTEQKFRTSTPKDIKELIDLIAQLSTDTRIISRTGIIYEDPDDNKILDCAVNSKSEFLITYDQHLLKLAKFKRVKIVHPTEFLRNPTF